MGILKKLDRPVGNRLVKGLSLVVSRQMEIKKEFEKLAAAYQKMVMTPDDLETVPNFVVTVEGLKPEKRTWAPYDDGCSRHAYYATENYTGPLLARMCKTSRPGLCPCGRVEWIA